MDEGKVESGTADVIEASNASDAAKLKKKKDSVRKKRERENESPGTRTLRLQNLAEHAATSRALAGREKTTNAATVLEQIPKKKKDSDRKKRERENESPDSRTLRLQNLAEHAATGREKTSNSCYLVMFR